MSLDRRTTNPGKRERAARKRCRRSMAYDSIRGKWFKLGRKHSGRWARQILAVADSRNASLGGSVMSLPAPAQGDQIMDGDG